MSHVVKINCAVVDLDAFEQAIGDRAELRRGQKTFTAYEGQRHCDHAVVKQGCRHSIGLTPRTDGQPGWQLAYDSWGPGQALDAAFGSGLVGLQNDYLAVVAEKQLSMAGYMVERQVEGERIHLYARA